MALLMIELFVSHGSAHDRAVCLSRFRSLSGCSPLTALFMIELFASHGFTHDRAVCRSPFCSIQYSLITIPYNGNITSMSGFVIRAYNYHHQAKCSHPFPSLSSYSSHVLLCLLNVVPPKNTNLGRILIVLTYKMRFLSYGSDSLGTVL